MLAASSIGFAAAKCLRKLNASSIIIKLRNFIYSQTAKYQYELKSTQLSFEKEQEYSSYVASLALLSSTIEKNLMGGEFELSYDSIRTQAKRRVAWFTLIQSFYDVNEIDPTETHQIPEHILVKGIFDLVWYGEIEFVNKQDYENADAKYGTPAKVAKYIDDHFEEDACKPENIYKINAEHTALKNDFNVGDQVYLFAPNYNLRDPVTGKVIIDEEYTPSQVYDERINKEFAVEAARLKREYKLDYLITPSIIQYDGVITEKTYTAADSFEAKTAMNQIVPTVKVRLDFNGKEYIYPITKLFLKKARPVNKPASIWKPTANLQLEDFRFSSAKNIGVVDTRKRHTNRSKSKSKSKSRSRSSSPAQKKRRIAGGVSMKRKSNNRSKKAHKMP